MKGRCGTVWVAICALWIMVGCGGGSRDLMDLQDGQKLQLDCARLITDLPPGDVPIGLWTTSIKQLNPLRVTRENNCIRIVVQQKRGRFTLGYDVFADLTQARPPKGYGFKEPPQKGFISSNFNIRHDEESKG